jgi:general stress protein 26
MAITTQTIFNEIETLNQPLGVLATISKDGVPHATSVFYIADEQLNLYFLAREGSKKYENILANPHVAFVVTEENPPKTIQFEGTAQMVTDAHEENAYFSKLIKRATEHSAIPPVAQMEGSKMLFIKITPTWVRAGNFAVMRKGDMFEETNLH